MSVYSDLEAAIDKLVVVDLMYDGSLRTVEPHLIGKNTKGNVCFSAFQIAGGSGYSFRTFLIDRISSVRETGQLFEGPRPGYNANDATMVEIFACL